MSKKNKQISEHIIAAIATVCAIAMLCLLLLFCGLMRPFPPPPEYGVEVNLGYMDYGMGDEQDIDIVNNEETVEAVPVEEAVETADEVVEEVVETRVEETVAINKTENKKKQEEVEKVVEKPVEVKKPVVINQQALFPPKKATKTESTSEGIGDKAGDMGQAHGVKDASSYVGGSGSGGISFTLTGRTLVKLVKPQYNSDEQGIVVVRIWVNKSGTVIRVRVGEQGTTTMDENLWEMARIAALQSTFAPKDNAAEVQIGNISYKFVRSW